MGWQLIGKRIFFGPEQEVLHLDGVLLGDVVNVDSLRGVVGVLDMDIAF